MKKLKLETDFIDFVNLDFHLVKTSPFVDAGSMLYAPASDLEYILRPQGNGVNLGAYEN